VCLVKPIRHATTIPNSGVVVKFGDTIKVTCAKGYGINGSEVTEQDITMSCKADETFDECHGEFMLIFVNLIKQHNYGSCYQRTLKQFHLKLTSDL